MITAEERKAICEAREFNDKLLQGIADYTVVRMKNNPYCRRILEGANYQEFVSSPRRPDYFDENHFYLERVYVGHHSGGAGGHCTKEIMEEDPTAPTRDAVYLNRYAQIDFLFDALEIMANRGDETAREFLTCEIPPRPHSSEHKFMEMQKFIELCAINDSSGEKSLNNIWRYEQIKNDIQNKMLEDSQFKDDLMRLSSDIILNEVAHECSHANQMNFGTKWQAQESRSLYGKKADEKEEENIKIVKKEIEREHKKWSKEKQIDGYCLDAIAEAGVMAHSYIAMLSVNPDKAAIEKINNFLYAQRLSEADKMKEISEEERAAMFAMENGAYTPDAVKRQQKLARQIFTNICKEFVPKQVKKADKNAQPDYNMDGSFQEIKGSYQEYIFGSIDEYIAAIPEPGLNKERIKELKEFVAARDGKNKETIKKLQEFIAVRDGKNKESSKEAKEFVAGHDGKDNSPINQMLLKKFNSNDR